MEYWIISSKESRFRVHDYFSSHILIDWTVRNKMNIGDLVFIYCSNPISAVQYYLKVIETDIAYSDSINDQGYWGKTHQSNMDFLNKKFIRLLLLGYNPSNKISLTFLHNLGIKGNIQGPRKISKEIFDQILSSFEIKVDDLYTNSDEHLFKEGKQLTSHSTLYERNPVVREKCIQKYGYTCNICGFDFYKTYGEVGKDFIEVHHIQPVSSIGHEHLVNPTEDLIPICSNCHRMLHRKVNGHLLSPDELRQIFVNKNNNSGK